VYGKARFQLQFRVENQDADNRARNYSLIVDRVKFKVTFTIKMIWVQEKVFYKKCFLCIKVIALPT
jgi:hypothetical protein